MTIKIIDNMFIPIDIENYVFYPNGKNNAGYKVDKKIKKSIIRSYQYYFIFLFMGMPILGYVNKVYPVLLLITIPAFFRLVKFLYCKDKTIKGLSL